MEFLFWVPGCLLTGKWRVKKSRGLSALYTERKMNCLVIGWMLSWVTIKILTCVTDATQGKRYVDAHQEQSLITASWSSLRDKGIYQQFNYSCNTLAFMQDKKESAVCPMRFQARLKSKECGHGWPWFCESPTAYLQQIKAGIILLKSIESSVFMRMGHLAQIQLESLQYHTSESSEVFLESLILRLCGTQGNYPLLLEPGPGIIPQHVASWV